MPTEAERSKLDDYTRIEKIGEGKLNYKNIFCGGWITLDLWLYVAIPPPHPPLQNLCYSNISIYLLNGHDITQMRT